MRWWKIRKLAKKIESSISYRPGGCVEVEIDKQKEKELISKIISIGVNSISPTGPDADLLEQFVNQPIQYIEPCWEYLNENNQFRVFKVLKSDFQNYLKKSSQPGGE